MRTENDAPEYLASLSDLILTVHKIDGKVSKLFEVITGDKDLGTEGLIIKNFKLEQRIKELEDYRSKLLGIFIAAGVGFGIIWEVLKNFIHK